jgi:hypothetical protein
MYTYNSFWKGDRYSTEAGRAQSKAMLAGVERVTEILGLGKLGS